MPIPSNQITIAEVKLFGQIASGGSLGKNTVTTLHFRRTATVLAVSHLQVDTAFQAAIVAKVLLALSVRWAQTGNTVRWLNDALDPPNFQPHANPGTITGDSMPAANTVYTLMQSALRGKSYRGNFKLGVPGESATTIAGDDVLNAGAVTYFGNVASAVLNGFVDSNGNQWVPCVVSRKLSQLTANPTNIVSADVIACRVNKRIGRLDSRQPASVY